MHTLTGRHQESVSGKVELSKNELQTQTNLSAALTFQL